MDNLCHTLAGAALGEAGLKRRTPLAMATLIVGANLPDLDAAAYAWGQLEALGFRRGWTHGVLAMALWPVLLAGLVLACDRWVRRRLRPDAAPAGALWVLVLAALAVWSHPLLDFLNTYGVRFLMPFSGRWFYGDTLFIVDPWVELALALGIWRSRRLSRRGAALPGRPARLALAGAALYVLLMGLGTLGGRRLAAATLPDETRFMVAPVPVLPFLRRLVADLGTSYQRGVVVLLPSPGVAPALEVEASGRGLPEAEAAARSQRGRTFLGWARFPVFRVQRDGTAALVTIGDERYPNAAWAEVSVRVARAVSLAAPPPATTERP